MTKISQKIWLGENVMKPIDPTPDEAIAELMRLGVTVGSDMVIDPQIGKSSLRHDYKKNLSETADDIMQQILNLWKNIFDVCRGIRQDSSCSASSARLALSSLECLCCMASRSEVRMSDQAQELFKMRDIIDISKIPSPSCSELASLLSKLSLLEFMVARLSYKDYLIDFVQFQKQAATNDGPYGRLDLPMGDRVTLWRDIEESIEGDSTAKKSQLRYKSWTEAYNEPRFRSGFYWRERANEPYLIDDAKNESPYKYREYLWRHLG